MLSHKADVVLFLYVLQLGGPDYPAVIVEQVPHSHLLSYSGLACEQLQTHEDHQQLLKGQWMHHCYYWSWPTCLSHRGDGAKLGI